MSSAYEVRVRGPASVRLLESLCAEVDMQADTVLHGTIEDQAALHGLLDRIRDIGLEIVDIRQVTYWPGAPLDQLGSASPLP
jgi:hypothetical protein